jgi:hypothetical protein
MFPNRTPDAYKLPVTAGSHIYIPEKKQGVTPPEGGQHYNSSICTSTIWEAQSPRSWWTWPRTYECGVWNGTFKSQHNTWNMTNCYIE